MALDMRFDIERQQFKRCAPAIAGQARCTWGGDESRRRGKPSFGERRARKSSLGSGVREERRVTVEGADRLAVCRSFRQQLPSRLESRWAMAQNSAFSPPPPKRAGGTPGGQPQRQHWKTVGSPDAINSAFARTNDSALKIACCLGLTGRPGALGNRRAVALRVLARL
ncbi:hypothetical protein PSPO01_05629 [Paraphaeosphaeria sporulosa]